jgi:hypothetical protein
MPIDNLWSLGYRVSVAPTIRENLRLAAEKPEIEERAGRAEK